MSIGPANPAPGFAGPPAPYPVFGNLGGGAVGMVTRVESATPEGQYVLGSAGLNVTPQGGLILSQQADEVLQRFGPRAYEMMLADDQVGASVDLKKVGILGTGLRMQPRIRPVPGEDLAAPADPGRAEAVAQSAYWHAVCERAVGRIGADAFHAWCWEMLDAVAFRQVCAEKVMAEVEAGEDAGLYTYTRIPVKHRLNWSLVVSPFMEVIGVYARTPAGPMVLPRSKFAIFTWHPRSGDPRGTSDLRRAYNPWNLKIQRQPQRAKWTNQFGTPSLLIKYNPGLQSTYPLDPATGQPDYTKAPLTADQQAQAAAEGFLGGSYLLMPNDWDATVIEARPDGGAFAAADADDNRSIAQAILLANRATNEAKNGSRADSDTAADMVMLGLAEGSAAFARFIEREVWHPMIEFNAGREAADLHTPECSFPMPKSMQAALWSAAAVLLNTGKVPTGTMPRLFEAAGLPVPTSGEIAAQKAEDEAAAEKAASRAAPGNAAPAGTPAAEAGTSSTKPAVADDGEKP